MQLWEPQLENWCRDQMKEPPVLLEPTQREIVETVIDEHCTHRSWTLHAVNCRTNHCHIVVTAPEYAGKQVRDQFKAWATRRLREDETDRLKPERSRENWWTRKGSVRHLFDEESLEAAVIYTLEAQDKGGSKANQQ
jgi:REP element-mobilizing transposase RayT